MQNKKGFSLIGLLITVVIVMILATIVVTQYQTINKAEQVRTEQTLRQLQSSVKDIEKAAVQRADFNPAKRDKRSTHNITKTGDL